MSLHAPEGLLYQLLAAGAAFALSSSGKAGYEVEQKLKLGGAANDLVSMSWKIDSSAFRLDVSSKGSETRTFVFNGRVFYVCGKPDAKSLAIIQSKGVLSDKASKKLQQGACQEASTDFAIRFALSPYEAVSAARSTIGYGVSTTLSNYELKATGKNENLTAKASKGSQACMVQSRRYTIVDKNGESRVDETLCNSSTLDWRQRVGRELMMSLMRRRDKEKARETVKIDQDKIKGLVLRSKGRSTHVGGSAIEFSLTTEKWSEKAFDRSELSVPQGYHTLDVATLAGLRDVKVDAKLKSKESGDITDLFEQILLGVNPNSILTRVVADSGLPAPIKDEKALKAKPVSSSEDDDEDN